MPKKTTPQLSVTPPPSSMEDWIRNEQRDDASPPVETASQSPTSNESGRVAAPVLSEKERRCTFPLPETLYRKVKIRSATTGEGMQSLFKQAVESFLQE